VGNSETKFAEKGKKSGVRGKMVESGHMREPGRKPEKGFTETDPKTGGERCKGKAEEGRVRQREVSPGHQK